jgi:hypothetical protein
MIETGITLKEFLSLGSISSAPRSRVAPGKTMRQRSWVVRTLLILAADRL